MFVGLDGGSVIAVFPERSLPVLALVISLRGAAGNELPSLSDNVRPVS
jgi:hypothetical protein